MINHNIQCFGASKAIGHEGRQYLQPFGGVLLRGLFTFSLLIGSAAAMPFVQNDAGSTVENAVDTTAIQPTVRRQTSQDIIIGHSGIGVPRDQQSAPPVPLGQNDRSVFLPVALPLQPKMDAPQPEPQNAESNDEIAVRDEPFTEELIVVGVIGYDNPVSAFGANAKVLQVKLSDAAPVSLIDVENDVALHEVPLQKVPLQSELEKITGESGIIAVALVGADLAPKANALLDENIRVATGGALDQYALDFWIGLAPPNKVIAPQTRRSIGANGIEVDARGIIAPDPLAVLTQQNVAAKDLPFIRRHDSIKDGDQEQYRVAITFTPTPTTRRKTDINSYFTNPPDTDGITLDLRDVLTYTLKNSPEIGMARWRAVDATHAVRAARAPLLPQVEISGATGVEGNHIEAQPRVSILQRSEAKLRVSQKLFDFDRTGLEIRRAKSLLQSQELQRRDIIEDTVFSAVTAYLNLLGAEKLVLSSEENVRAHERIVRLVDKNFEVGNMSEAETKRARTRLDRARTNAIDLKNRRERALGTFRRVTGLEGAQLVEPQLDMRQAYSLQKGSIDKYLQDNPAMQAVMRDINSLEHQIKAVSRANLPEVSLQVAGAYKQNVLGNEAWASDARAMVAATWTAYDGGAAQARRQQLIARKRESEQGLILLRNELKQDAYNIINVLESSREKRSIYEDQVDASQRVVELYEKQFEAGRRTLLELLDAQADLSVAREESIATVYENLSASVGSLRIQNVLTETMMQQLLLPTLVAQAQ